MDVVGTSIYRVPIECVDLSRPINASRGKKGNNNAAHREIPARGDAINRRPYTIRFIASPKMPSIHRVPYCNAGEKMRPFIAPN
jgi:hypothetical protein